jgi:hypothetical protein
MTKPKVIKLPGGTLDVYCWCQRRIVKIPAAEIRAGRTASCGAAACRPTRGASPSGP